MLRPSTPPNRKGKKVMLASVNALPINPGHTVRDRLRSYLAAVQRRSFEKRSLKQLQALSGHTLRDIGMTRDESLRTTPRPLQHLVF
jgi:uncharacterized protein YjiS (DUF1127 family)